MTKNRTNSVLIPSAQTTKLCMISNTDETELNIERAVSIIIRNESKLIAFIVCIMYRYGMRISEVLSISYKNITKRNQIIIQGCKGSSDRFIDMSDFLDVIVQIKHGNFKLSDIYNRFFIYRLLKKYNIGNFQQYGTKTAVCHSFRYQFAKSIQENTNNIETTAHIIGHKNTSNTKKYVKNAR